MKNNDRIVYSINVEDIQTVAIDELGRPLTNKEVKLVEEKFGDYLGWYEAIALAIGEKKRKEDE